MRSSVSAVLSSVIFISCFPWSLFTNRRMLETNIIHNQQTLLTIPTSPTSHNAPFCNRNVHTCAHFCYKIVLCGIWTTLWEFCNRFIASIANIFVCMLFLFTSFKIQFYSKFCVDPPLHPTPLPPHPTPPRQSPPPPPPPPPSPYPAKYIDIWRHI